MSYYTNGEFVDEYNQTIEILEILNDPEIEHQYITSQTYSILYDQLVTLQV